MLEKKILLTDCPDDKGLIAKITNICYKHQLNILHNNEFVDFEIVKLSNGCYYFTDKDLRITSCFYKEDIVGFLKSYFSIRDLFASHIKSLLKSLKKTNKELQKVHKDLDSAKLRSDLEVADSIYEENKSLKKQCKAIKVELNNLKGKLQSSNKALLKASNVIKDAINTIKI